ncbi:MAG: hypothetical protein A49_08520 [Methyloceanibacter sp.]|nr:MAG: hypothetical protein A49_08520 [Methyloceanibacter sp.]
MTNEEVWEALVRWLHTETELPTIKAHPSGKPPSTPYLMLNLLNVREVRTNVADIEFEDLETVNSEGKQEVLATPVMEAEWEFSVHSYGEGDPSQILRVLKSRVHLAQRLEPMLPELVIHETGAINNVPDWANNAWEPRAHMKMFVRGYTRDGAVIDAIEEASFGASRT